MATAPKPVNRWRNTKVISKAGMQAGNAGLSVATQAMGVPNIALIAAGAAASATGIGLVVTGAALTLTTSVLSARSAHKSRLHRNALQQIQQRVNTYECRLVDIGDPGELGRITIVGDVIAHQAVADDVLPYAIQQKENKYHRKAVGAVPVVGLGETVRAVGKKLLKWHRGTLGVQRAAHAATLAEHLITHDCALAQAIVAELFSFDEMLWLLQQEYEEVHKLLAAKLQST